MWFFIVNSHEWHFLIWNQFTLWFYFPPLLNKSEFSSLSSSKRSGRWWNEPDSFEDWTKPDAALYTVWYVPVPSYVSKVLVRYRFLIFLQHAGDVVLICPRKYTVWYCTLCYTHVSNSKYISFIHHSFSIFINPSSPLFQQLSNLLAGTRSKNLAWKLPAFFAKDQNNFEFSN